MYFIDHVTISNSLVFWRKELSRKVIILEKCKKKHFINTDISIAVLSTGCFNFHQGNGTNPLRIVLKFR